MVVGSGLMASAFADYKDTDKVLIFASGVSNSLETDENEFFREMGLLTFCLGLGSVDILVYFSSVPGHNPLTQRYMRHKEEMERIIKTSGTAYLILQLPQVVGCGGNENTLVNFLVNKIWNDETIDVYKDTYRAVIDVDDIHRIVGKLLSDGVRGIYPIPYIERLYVENIVRIIGRALGKVPKINLIENNESKTLFRELGIEPEGYIERTITKYLG
jgi:hypothetical protein